MSMENKEKVNENVTHENKDNSENKTYKKRMSRQTAMTIAMILVTIFVISVATYAWYLITNTPKVTNMEFRADTKGDLYIAELPTLSDPTSVPEAGDYGSYIELKQDDANVNAYLSPVTTADGVTFYRPVYTNGDVTDVKALVPGTYSSKGTDYTLFHTKYVYEKTFYLRAGDSTVNTSAPKYYDIYLVGKTGANNDYDMDGCYMYTETVDENGNKALDSSANTSSGAENALRVSFVFEKDKTFEKADNNAYSANSTEVIKIYEPNADIRNTVNGTGINTSGANRATITANVANLAAYDSVTYNVTSLKQLHNRSFNIINDSDSSIADKVVLAADEVATYVDGTDEKSARLCTIKENEPVKVTMRIWIEGSDGDCVNEIAAKYIKGQIQFISEENTHQFEKETTTTTIP